MSKILNKNDHIALVANSNGISLENKPKIDLLVSELTALGLKPIISPIFYRNYGAYNGSGKERAEVLNEYFNDEKIKAIFDVSGGDLSNETLEYIDFNAIKDNQKPFFGYSDLSTLLNSINKLSNINTFHYQIRNLIGNYNDVQKEYFIRKFFNDNIEDFNYRFIRGTSMEGIVIGGNIRCLLKLSGTKYQPDFNNKILFLESLSGDSTKIATFLNQYKQIGAFENLKGIILGTFTEMENKQHIPTVENLLLDLIPKDVPIIKTTELGHGEDCKCIIIGKKYTFK